MLKKKVCIVGSFGVGKTSLVARFVEGIFSEKYLSTIGVKIDKKLVEVDGTKVSMMLWDMAGEEKFEHLQTSYLRGASGVLLVADGTRKETLARAASFLLDVRKVAPDASAIMLVNKADLQSDWEVGEMSDIAPIVGGCPFHLTSAKTGDHVEEAFSELARMMTSDD